MQTSAMKTCFQIAECSLSYAKIRVFFVTSKFYCIKMGESHLLSQVEG